MGRASRTDILGDRLAARHLEADDLATKNANVKVKSKLKFPRGTSKDVKDLTWFYVSGRFSNKRTSIGDAFDLYTGYQQDEGSPRWTLEALILGGETDKGIFELCGIAKKAVYYYRRFYFDVETPGNRQMLMLKSGIMFKKYGERDAHRWGYKIEVELYGLDWFKRVRLFEQPTLSDAEKLDSLVMNRMGKGRLDASLMMGNMGNYRFPAFLEMLEKTGATYKQLTDAADKAAKSGSGGGALTNELFMKALGESMDMMKYDPRDIKKSSFAKTEDAVEELFEIEE